MGRPGEKKVEKEEPKAPFTIVEDPEIMNASSPMEAAEIGRRREMEEHMEEVRQTAQREQEEAEKQKKNRKETKEEKERREALEREQDETRQRQMENDPAFAEQQRNMELDNDMSIEAFKLQKRKSSSELELAYRHLPSKTGHEDLANAIAIGKLANERLAKHWPFFRYFSPSFYAERRIVEKARQDIALFTKDPERVEELLAPIDMSSADGKQQFVDEVADAFKDAQNRQADLVNDEPTVEEEANQKMISLLQERELAAAEENKELYQQLGEEIQSEQRDRFKQQDEEAKDATFELEGLQA